MAAPTKDNSHILGLVLDFETGGTKSQICGITQIAVHAYRLDTFEYLGSYVNYIQPYNRRTVKAIAAVRKTLKSKYDKPEEIPMEYSEGAEKVTGITRELLEEKGVSLEEAAQGLIDFVKGNMVPKTPKNKLPIFIGHNFVFDEAFLCQMFEYTNLLGELKKIIRGYEDFYGNWHPHIIDTLTMGQLALCHNSQVPNYKLSTVAEFLGVELVDAHEADADVLATANILTVLTRRMRRNGMGDSENEEDEIQITKAAKSRPHFRI